MTTKSTFLLAGACLATLALGGCGMVQRASIDAPSSLAQAYVQPEDESILSGGPLGPVDASAYAAVEDDGFVLPAIPINKIDPQFLRQRVVYDGGGGYEPGTVVVDTPHHFLYVVEPRGTAMRYGIGVGKAGFSWAGEAEVKDKQHWPKWFPPKEMIERRPDLQPYGNEVGMEPGLMNPLGSRALYLYQNGRDTLYRLHGTPEWWSIGKSVSSGCIRLMNQDIRDLYDRVPMNARVVVLQGSERLVSAMEAPQG